MADYTLSLRTESDCRIIKKLLKAFDGAKVTPVRQRKTSLERSLEEAEKGSVVGPYDSVEQLMSDLLN